MLGLLAHDVRKAHPHEGGELVYVVEFVLDTTPSATGYCPRDKELSPL